jgi:predicted nucleic acid-binding protein
MPRPILDNALTRLEAFFEEAHTVAASEEVRLRAGRLLAVHALRAADALQLAAALVSCEEEPIDERLVSLDQRLREAALLEGFVVIPE